MQNNEEIGEGRQATIIQRMAMQILVWALSLAIPASIYFVLDIDRGLGALAGDVKVLAQRVHEHDRRFDSANDRNAKLERQIAALDQRCRIEETGLAELRAICGQCRQ